ncbi:MAG TPA: metallophosphoesterase [Pyrinomonadaceae bacterium]|nr:metallophosphoesterase [Pyrinomonadaceae bacterium]
MLTTVVLRYRDLLADTIAQHAKLLREAAEVWWGWWRKPNEPQRLVELAQLKTKTGRQPVEVGIFDRSKAKFAFGTVADCIFSESGALIKSPDELKTPEYYRDKSFPAWFKLTKLEEVDLNRFLEKFSAVPIEDYTFFPVVGKKIAPSSGDRLHSSELINLKGNTIVHLSDLHFGSDFGFPTTALPGSYPLMTILEKDIKKMVGKDIGLLVISGDLTSRGDASHLFTVAIPFLHELRKALGLEPEHVVIVPGNHDISFKDFALTYDHEGAFNAFLNTFYGANRSAIELLKFRLPTDQVLEVLPINSIKLRSKETSNYGWVNWQAYDTVLDTLPKTEPNNLRMAVIHHHLVGALREERLPDSDYPYASVSVTLDAAAVVEGLQRHGFKFVLHGHQHNPALNRISRGRYSDGELELAGYDENLYVIAGGSTGVTGSRIDGDIRDNTYGVLKINEDNLALSVRQFNPSGNVRELYHAPLNI